MLIISIIMFGRKKNRFRIAYALLTGSAMCVVVYDDRTRSETSMRSAQIERAISSEPAASVPFNPIAQSPFPEARSGYSDSCKSAIAPAAQQSDSRTAPSAFYFLKVAVQVDSGYGPVALNRGARVVFLHEQDGKFLVTRNGMKFLIEKSQLTDDIASLSALARNSS